MNKVLDETIGKLPNMVSSPVSKILLSPSVAEMLICSRLTIIPPMKPGVKVATMFLPIRKIHGEGKKKEMR